MYLGRLANGSGDAPERRLARQKASIQRCRNSNPAAYKWTVAKYGVAPKASAYGGSLALARNKVMQECAAGWPEYWNWRIASQTQKLVPTAEETAEAFIEEVKKISPPLIDKPVLIAAPPDVAAPAPPPPVSAPDVRYTQPYVPPPNGTVPVDSQPQAPPPAAIAAEFPLMEQYRREQMEVRARPAADVTPNGVPPIVEKKAPGGIGTALALGIPIVLMMAGG